MDRLKQAAFRTSLYRYTLSRRRLDHLLFTPALPWPGDPQRANEIFQGRYRFAGREARAPNQPPWRLRADDTEWQRALHRCDWLADFAAVGGETAGAHARKLMRSWIDLCDEIDPPGWAPEVLGRRLFNAFGQAGFLFRGAEADYRHAVLDSLGRQWRHLGRVADDAPAGDGLLDACLGLVMGGLVIPDEEIRLEDALKRLQSVLGELVLADGGHVSRSPERQMTVMRDLHGLQCAIEQSGRGIPAWLADTLAGMAGVLAMLRHGDGGLALFNGATQGPDGAVAETLERLGHGKAKPPAGAPESGFERLQGKRAMLLVDVGTPPAGAVGALAHAGTASFEFSAGKHRIVTNCGGGRERSGGWAVAARGTAAQSTLVLDGRNSAEVLEAGGFGRRPRRVEVERRQDEAGSIWLEILHDGYAAGLGRLHRRRLYFGDDGHDLRGEDSIEPVVQAGGGARGPGLESGGELPFAVRFHLHPDVQASPVQGGNAVLLKVGNQGWRFRASGAEVQVEESIYLGRAGESRRTDQIVLNGIAGPEEKAVKWAFRKV